MGTSKNSTCAGPLKTAQMLGARKRATGAYWVVREDRSVRGSHAPTLHHLMPSCGELQPAEGREFAGNNADGLFLEAPI